MKNGPPSLTGRGFCIGNAPSGAGHDGRLFEDVVLAGHGRLEGAEIAPRHDIVAQVTFPTLAKRRPQLPYPRWFTAYRTYA